MNAIRTVTCLCWRNRNLRILSVALALLVTSTVVYIVCVYSLLSNRSNQLDKRLSYNSEKTGGVVPQLKIRGDGEKSLENGSLSNSPEFKMEILPKPGLLQETIHRRLSDTLVNRRTLSKPWKEFISGITTDELYLPSSVYIPELLKHLSNAKIEKASILRGGSQSIFLLQFEDGNKVVAKPMRHPRDFYWAYNETQPFWMDEERHTAEIASFHLDRILNYRRVSPCAGRRLNFTSEILNNTDDEAILNTLRRKDGKTCFTGRCPDWFCNEDHMICAHNDVMEIAVCQILPGGFGAIKHPWSQGIKESLVWKNKSICESVINNPGMRVTESRFFLDIMELALFDHLIVNYDRHHIDKMNLIDSKRTFVLLLDNGKGFGNPFKDDITLLAPIYQCCRFRNSTYQHILSLTKNNNTLGDLMKRSLSQDPLAPILTEPFFAALDRRLDQFYSVISKCIQDRGADIVLSEKFP